MALPRKLIDELLKLPAGDRRALGHVLLDSAGNANEADGDDGEIAAAWSAEIERRVRSIDDGSAELVDAELVFAEIEEVIRSAARGA